MVDIDRLESYCCNASECPVCHQLTIPEIKPDEIATGTVCQNPDCRVVVDRQGNLTGRWTPGYGQFVPIS